MILTIELINKLYYEENLSIKKIAKQVNLTDRTIRKFMEENHLKLKQNKDLQELSIDIKKDIEILYKEGYNPREISEKIFISQSKIKSYLISSNLWNKKNNLTKKELQEMYLVEKLTIREIANRKQCSIKKIELALKKFKIRKHKNYIFNERELEILYIKHNLSISKIARLKNSTNYFVKKALKEYNMYKEVA